MNMATPALPPPSRSIAAPMSFQGSLERMEPMFHPYGSQLATYAAYAGLSLVLALWWAVIACWYLLIISFPPPWLVPFFRWARRRQRRLDIYREQTLQARYQQIGQQRQIGH